MKFINLKSRLIISVLIIGSNISRCEENGKKHSAFFPNELINNAKENIKKYPWALAIKNKTIDLAEPFRKMSDNELWDSMFGSTLPRSWKVWANKPCPSCKKIVSIYGWKFDAIKFPWKAQCPYCKELFPKNDFAKYYASGLDEHGIFSPAKADRKLLVNSEHPNIGDPLQKFGVDDGKGYVEGSNRWNFISTYLIYGQWYQKVLAGIETLANAYTVTGDPVYARKAGILLDRVADLYPDFDGSEQIITEGMHERGAVSPWYVAPEDTRKLALAYDQIFEAIKQDRQLIAFLSRKASQYKLENKKSSFHDIQKNIETRILRDSLVNRIKIESNFPRTDICFIMIKTILGWPDNKPEIYKMLNSIIARSTKVDGLSGEKGLAIYSAQSVQALGTLLALYAQMDDKFLADMVKINPNLKKTYRFYIDVRCGKYYPQSGDTGIFGSTFNQYQGINFLKSGLPVICKYHMYSMLPPSMYTFMWKLYKLTGDYAYLQVIYEKNNNSSDGLPYDLYAKDSAQIVSDIEKAVKEYVPPGSVNKQQWHLAILRSGTGDNARSVWLDYDSMGGHGHADGMNLGLFAKDLDLMPDLGYPPTQYGGWSSPRALWYQMSSAHNTAIVDRDNHSGKSYRYHIIPDAGKTSLWADGKSFHAIRATGANIIGEKQFERTAVLVDIAKDKFYVVDILRMAGGKEHCKFFHSFLGKINYKGLDLKKAPDYGHGTQMRNFKVDKLPKPGWQVDWTIEDYYKVRQGKPKVHLRYTDLSKDVEAYLAEGWISIRNDQKWIPRIMVRKAGKTPLSSTFVSVIEPYESVPAIKDIKHINLLNKSGKLYPDNNVALEITLADGSRDIILSTDIENPLSLTPNFLQERKITLESLGVEFNCELGMIRLGKDGKVKKLMICRNYGCEFAIDDIKMEIPLMTNYMEIDFTGAKPKVLSGNPWQVVNLEINGKKATVE